MNQPAETPAAPHAKGMDQFFSFNINRSVFVKLRPEGIEHYKRHCEEHVPPSMHKPLSEYASRANADGYFEFQAWVFLSMFGHLTHIGFAKYYETEVLFERTDLKAATPR